MSGTKYVLSFDAYSDSPKTINATIADKNFKIALTTEKKTYKNSFTLKSKKESQELAFLLGSAGTTYIDNVRIQEDALVINGNFSAGFTAFELYAHDSAKVDYTVDTTFRKGTPSPRTFRKTGDQDWMIQLKQSNITLEKGKWYVLSFDAKSTIDRTIMYALQRDGSGDNNWIPYSGTQKIDIGPKSKNYKVKFQMNEATDKATILSISMGAVDGKIINKNHTVTIDNIKLEQTK